LIAAPDVPTAAGLDLLDARLELIRTLFAPEAQQLYGLRFPKGMVLWGPPGTGKSLSAKLAAKKMGVPLLAVDWAAIRSESELRFLLQTAEAMSPCVLYFDDFDKGFAGWDSNSEGGLARRRAGKLLTWMQEHHSQVLVVATVNRLGMLPPELIRRFEEEIYFVDLPHDGARYEIFNLHLAKYFPAFGVACQTGVSPWSERQWRQLLVDYRLCTPAEIGNAVRRVAQEAYYRLVQAGRVGEALSVTCEDLLEQRWTFTPALEREEGAILEIRNQAPFAKPAAGADRSVFARSPQELFEPSPELNSRIRTGGR
jgi:SpoVK/Ycf46/Vps4 family AAA+-type ATPase